MKKILTMLLALVLVLSLVACGQDETEANGETALKAIANVNGKDITEDEYVKNLKILEYAYKAYYGDEVLSQEVNGVTVEDIIKDELLTSMIREVLIIDEVNATGYENDDAQIEEMYASLMETDGSNEDLMSYYEEYGIDEAFLKESIAKQLYVEEYLNIIRDEVSADETKLSDLSENYKIEVEASHILVETIEEANDIIAKINSEEATFEDLAKELSIDTGSGENGGELGFFGRNVMVAEFETAAFSQEVGVVGEPVQSQYGFHIIKVTDYRTVNKLVAEGASEEEVASYKDTLISMLADEEYNTRISALVENSEIEKFVE